MKTLNAWLRPNLLTDAPNDFIAVPVIVGSIGITEIIDELKKEGMEIKTETAVDILSRFNRKVAEMLTQGYSVNTGLAYIKPAIKGVFTDKTWNPEKHSIYFNMVQGVVLREIAKTAKAEILGEQSSPMSIFSITDKATGKTDGTLTQGKNTEIKGTYIKIAGDHSDNGIYFTNVETKAKIKVEASDIVINEPSRLMILVPATLEAGNYELNITTQYSQGTTALKEPRTAILSATIVIA